LVYDKWPKHFASNSLTFLTSICTSFKNILFVSFFSVCFIFALNSPEILKMCQFFSSFLVFEFPFWGHTKLMLSSLNMHCALCPLLKTVWHHYEILNFFLLLWMVSHGHLFHISVVSIVKQTTFHTNYIMFFILLLGNPHIVCLIILTKGQSPSGWQYNIQTKIKQELTYN
jgi:hypothetical protein